MSNSPVLIYNSTSAASPAVGVGANLGSLGLPGFANDIVGVQWPQTGAWDIGAYEFVPGTVAIPIANGTQSGPLTWNGSLSAAVRANGISP